MPGIDAIELSPHAAPRRRRTAALTAVLSLLLAGPCIAQSETLAPHQQLARDIYRELVETNTVTATGETAAAAEAMAARLRTAGFPADDVQVFKPAPHKGNLVARLRGTGARRPILLLAHLDVVEAKREDWSTDPFRLVEQDGYFYGRGTGDDKFMAAAFVAALIRYKQEDFRPDRDLILVLETDEEILDRNAVGIQWLIKNHRDLIDAEFALNEGAGVGLKGGRPLRISVQTSEKVPVNYVLEVRSPGGHSSLPTKDNAIYRLAAGLVRLGQFDFPVQLDDTTRAWLRQAAALEEPQVAADMRSVAAGELDAGTSAQFWPDTPVIPTMSTGATDSSFLRNAGIPTYGHSGLALDIDDAHFHGKDERVPVQSFYDGLEYLYRLVKALAS